MDDWPALVAHGGDDRDPMLASLPDLSGEQPRWPGDAAGHEGHVDLLLDAVVQRIDQVRAVAARRCPADMHVGLRSEPNHAAVVVPAGDQDCLMSSAADQVLAPGLVALADHVATVGDVVVERSIPDGDARVGDGDPDPVPAMVRAQPLES